MVKNGKECKNEKKKQKQEFDFSTIHEFWKKIFPDNLLKIDRNFEFFFTTLFQWNNKLRDEKNLDFVFTIKEILSYFYSYFLTIFFQIWSKKKLNKTQ